jgi:TetR/AcrR family transcriptional regulator, mexJK operon transcriptional repressor
MKRSTTEPTITNDAPVQQASRSDRKRQVILEAAAQAFLSNGYTRTSMDEIARLAGVSKQTLYMHFGDKERLLFDIVMAIVTSAGDPVDEEIARLGESTDLDKDLRNHARRQLTQILQPQPMQLRRLVIAEAVTFPALGRAFYELGPGRTITQLANAFERLGKRGQLNITDPARAASDFNWLVMSDPLNRAMLLGDNGPPGPQSTVRWADQAVRTFLAAYRN